MDIGRERRKHWTRQNDETVAATWLEQSFIMSIVAAWVGVATWEIVPVMTIGGILVLGGISMLVEWRDERRAARGLPTGTASKSDPPRSHLSDPGRGGW